MTTDTAAGIQPFGFAGGIYDPDTGLVHYGVRDYSPVEGIWLTPDPIDFRSGDTNLYAYAGGDPLNRVDPTGLFIVPVDPASAAAFETLRNDPLIGGWIQQMDQDPRDVFVNMDATSPLTIRGRGGLTVDGGRFGYGANSILIEWDLRRCSTKSVLQRPSAIYIKSSGRRPRVGTCLCAHVR